MPLLCREAGQNNSAKLNSNWIETSNDGKVSKVTFQTIRFLKKIKPTWSRNFETNTSRQPADKTFKKGKETKINATDFPYCQISLRKEKVKEKTMSGTG